MERKNTITSSRINISLQVFGAFDAIVTVVISHLITTAWIPSRLKARLYFIMRTQLKSSSNVKQVDPRDGTDAIGQYHHQDEVSKRQNVSQSEIDISGFQVTSRAENSSVYQ